MENTLQGAHASGGEQSGVQRVEVTSLGWLLIIIVMIAAIVFGWGAYQHHESAVLSPAGRASLPVQPHPEQKIVTQAQPQAPSAMSVAQQSADLLNERREHVVQFAASRAVGEVEKQQLADLNAGLQALDAKIDAMSKAPAQPRRDNPAEVSKNLHKALDTAKATAAIDVESLPIETVTPQALNVSGFGEGVVEIGGQKLTAGQSLQQGETIVAIDAKSKSIVTNRRILNVTN
jgi:predicted negative regulator of RcsB-dependent stress response